MSTPVCGYVAAIRQAQEGYCVRPPHKHGDHEDAAGNRWPSYEGEDDEILIITTADLRGLLDAPSEQPVLYVARDETTGEPVRLEVGAEAHLPNSDDIIVRKDELVDALGGPDHPDGVTEGALEGLLEGLQDIIATTTDHDSVPDDACVDGDGDVHPEHDYPPVGQGVECRRCGAELGDEPDGIYDGEVR